MAIEFRGVDFGPLRNLTATAPEGAVIGIIGEKGSGKGALLRLAAGMENPTAGQVLCAGSRRYLGPGDSLQLSPVDLLAIEHSFSTHDALVRARARVGIDRLRSAGATVLLVSHENDLLRSLADEIWWLDAGVLHMRGDPGEVLDAYRHRIAEKFRTWGDSLTSPLSPAMRRGDGRAEIVSIATLDASSQPTMVLRSGEAVTVRVVVRYQDEVAEPVIGMMIRSRIGLEVYGVNTGEEALKTGPVAPGDELQVEFKFPCNLCPGEYTVTAASHDPDGVAHDWMDDAVAFVVTDSRYTAGVANLRAVVTVEKRR